MSPARHTTADLAAASGLSINRVSQLADRGILLSPGDIPAAGTGRRRRYTDASLRKAVLVSALSAAGVQPGQAGRVAEQFYAAKVRPNDLLIIDRRGGARIAPAAHYQPTATASVVMDIGQLFADIEKKVTA